MTPRTRRFPWANKKEEDNPWEKLKNEYPIGSEFEAPVVSITKFGAFVRILPGIDGLVHISEISNERVNKVSDVLKVGDMVKVKLINVDFDRKRISLSMKLASTRLPRTLNNPRIAAGACLATGGPLLLYAECTLLAYTGEQRCKPPCAVW